MTNAFLEEILSKQSQCKPVPSNKTIARWASQLIYVLYPQLSSKTHTTVSAIGNALIQLENELVQILNATKACSDCNNQAISNNFFNNLPVLHNLLNTDIQAIHLGDPAAHTEFEVIRAYPGFYGLCFYRIAHALHEFHVPLIPRILSEYAHSKTGIDIHPAAKIGEYFMIDHGTGIVIGETAIIGQNVKMYQGVTLGALSIDKSMALQKRHPTIENNVIIYSGATILGGDTLVGTGSIIGGNVWLTKSVPPGSLVYHNPEITIVEGKFSD